ncbi:hypothetical protein NT6N_16480 [Oceaniferula spumae]|uniref:Verru_Chthon cassette protein A n=1 Tax=Oceaniferula spumae TaxID=2979115 RepID=A0AAT9FKY9_9BACT
MHSIVCGKIIRKGKPGFALVATISVMVLLVMIALAMLSLSTLETRSSRVGTAQQEARANARMALMIALGELQHEMGPDQRISTESAIFDQNKQTVQIDGLQQSRWCASYNAWGSWLNGSYTVPKLDGNSGNSYVIQDTYVSKREPMFRRWLLSLPIGMETDINAPVHGAGLTDDNSVVIVGKGTLGEGSTIPDDQITRAYLQEVTNRGRIAWWVSPENHKAKVPLSDNERTLSAPEWETAQGGTTEVGVPEIDGMDGLRSANHQAKRVITQGSIALADVDSDTAKKHFFNLTAHAKGLMTNLRLGGMKKDISLLFELNNNDLPARYRFSNGDVREPSIRPMTAELAGKNPKVPGRHFASWTNMRHYYRMYKSPSDATGTPTSNKGSLTWQGNQPATDIAMMTDPAQWNGSNHYQRLPILSKLTFIYSLQSVLVSNSTPKRYNCYLVYTPIYTFWNPYNVELRVPNRAISTLSLPYKILPLNYYGYLGATQQGGIRPVSQDLKQDHGSYFNSGSSSDIVFKPGEMKLFSYRSNGSSGGKQTNFYPGFDPQAIGGDKLLLFPNVTSSQRPGMAITFGNPAGEGGNVWFGNTPGGLNNPFAWYSPGNGRWLSTSYQHDWFRTSEADTQITPAGTSNIAYWQFSDNEPVPFSYNQFVIKTSSELDYESINWAKDWRCKNWMQAPGYYFGSGQFISNDEGIANTQRSDNPYVFHFGPMSSADMPKVVPHAGENAFLGSGSNPREKITAAPMLELPSAPLSSLAAFSNMRVNPGWTNVNQYSKASRNYLGAWNSLNNFDAKSLTYQSGVTGPAIGNSFLHPMLPSNDVYRFFDNSKSYDVSSWANNTTMRDNQAYNDFWDHTLLTNDALWDDYFVSTLSDPSRPTAGSENSLNKTVDAFLDKGKAPAYSRYQLYKGKKIATDIKGELLAKDGYLKAAQHIVVDGMFNVNSTSADAWFALFAGIRERQMVCRSNGSLNKIDVPSGKLIGISRFNTATTKKETKDVESGVTRSDGATAWSGVRFLDDAHLRKLAEECVKQVKLRGPFLNLSEFINRRLSDDELGLMGALQSAIDYDDNAPDSKSINYRYKQTSEDMISSEDISGIQYATPEAATGSRFTGIPGYVIQSDLLRPISNSLNTRDDTFRIRSYGESRDAQGNIQARAWCEAIVQRVPDYVDDTNSPEVPARQMSDEGVFSDNAELTETNRKWGRQFRIISFRWLNQDEI